MNNPYVRSYISDMMLIMIWELLIIFEKDTNPFMILTVSKIKISMRAFMRA